MDGSLVRRQKIAPGKEEFSFLPAAFPTDHSPRMYYDMLV
jgi:hypothetical protein